MTAWTELLTSAVGAGMGVGAIIQGHTLFGVVLLGVSVAFLVQLWSEDQL